jgi:hypothetical protein
MLYETAAQTPILQGRTRLTALKDNTYGYPEARVLCGPKDLGVVCQQVVPVETGAGDGRNVIQTIDREGHNFSRAK